MKTRDWIVPVGLVTLALLIRFGGRRGWGFGTGDGEGWSWGTDSGGTGDVPGGIDDDDVQPVLTVDGPTMVEP